jgi:hypothetical protein
MLIGIAIAVGPLVWAMVHDNRTPREELQEVVNDIEHLPFAEELVAARRLVKIPAQARLETQADTEDGESHDQHDWRGPSRRQTVRVPVPH